MTVSIFTGKPIPKLKQVKTDNVSLDQRRRFKPRKPRASPAAIRRQEALRARYPS